MRSNSRATQTSPAAGASRRSSLRSQPMISRAGSANHSERVATTAALSSGERRSTHPRRSPEEEATARATGARGTPASARAIVTLLPHRRRKLRPFLYRKNGRDRGNVATAGGGQPRARRRGRVELGEQREELELGVELAQQRRIGRIELQRLGMDLDRQVGVDGDQLLRQERLLTIGEQPFAIGLARHLGGARQQRLDRTVLGDELARPFLADSGHARHVVHRVPHQGEDVRDLLRRHAEILGHGGRVVALVAAGMEQGHVRPDELHQVLVGRHQHDLVALGHRLLRQRPHDVVGLVVVELEARNAERLDRLADVGDLRHQIVRHRGAIRLVVGELLGAHGLVGDVERNADEVRRFVLEDLAQDLHETEDGVGRQPLRVREVPDGEEGTEDVVEAVDQDELGAASRVRSRRYGSGDRRRRFGVHFPKLSPGRGRPAAPVRLDCR